MCKTKDINIAWIDAKKSNVGYEIPMTWYFYKYQEPVSSESLEETFNELENAVSERVKRLFG